MKRIISLMIVLVLILSFAVIPVDKAQYYGYLLISIQELLYLYDFPQLNLEYENDSFEEESMGGYYCLFRCNVWYKCC